MLERDLCGFSCWPHTIETWITTFYICCRCGSGFCWGGSWRGVWDPLKIYYSVFLHPGGKTLSLLSRMERMTSAAIFLFYTPQSFFFLCRILMGGRGWGANEGLCLLCPGSWRWVGEKPVSHLVLFSRWVPSWNKDLSAMNEKYRTLPSRSHTFDFVRMHKLLSL